MRTIGEHVIGVYSGTGTLARLTAAMRGAVVLPVLFLLALLFLLAFPAIAAAPRSDAAQSDSSRADSARADSTQADSIQASSTLPETIAGKPLTMQEVLEASPAEHWRPLDPDNTLYLELETGRVVMELAPAFAPEHVAAIRAMARAGVSNPAITRVQDNFVTQWRLTDGPADTLKAEFTRMAGPGLRFTPLPDGDVYAFEAGFVDGMPAARDPQAGAAWLIHCYGMVGVGRENSADSGNGAELYAVIGQAPRQLDRNMTMVGRIVSGMELLSGLPRGNGAMGFYEPPMTPVAIRAVRLAADVPAAERESLEIMRTDSSSFAALVESRRNRRDAFYHVPANAIDVCNVPVPVRKREVETAQAR